MSLLVLGATGYTGRAVLKHAVTQPQWQVTAMVRTLPPDPAPSVSYVIGALPDALPDDLSTFDAVLHLAVEKSTDDLRRLRSVNVDGTRAVLEALGDRTAIVYASSMSVYGQGAQHDVAEDHPLHPDTELAHTRYEAERIVLSMAEQRRTTAFVARPRFLIGRDDPSFLPSIRKYRSLPMRTVRPVQFSVIDIDDHATTLLRLAERAVERTRAGDAVQRAFNIGYRAPVTLERLCALVDPPTDGRAFGVPAELVRAVAARLPGGAATKLTTQLELVTRSHWGNVDAVAEETGLALFDKNPVDVLASYRAHGGTP